MSNLDLNASNKKSAGKGNGNSVINNEIVTKNVSDYVSGDYPSSTSHKFDENDKNKNKNVR